MSPQLIFPPEEQLLSWAQLASVEESGRVPAFALIRSREVSCEKCLVMFVEKERAAKTEVQMDSCVFFYYFKGFLNFETTRVRFFAFEENVWWDINLVWILSANLSNYMQIVIVIRMKFGIELVNLIHDNWERSRRFFEVSTYLRCSNINSSNRCFVSWKILTAILTISVRRPTQDILSRPCLYQSALNRFGQVLREFFQKPCFTSKRTSHDMKITNLKMTPISLHLFILGASGRK